MVLPSIYSKIKTLNEFISVVLKPYPDILPALTEIAEGKPNSNIYLGYHYFSVKDNVTVIHVRQHGITYQLSRSSNLRNTSGYERYILTIIHDDILQHDERIITHRSFINNWLPWVTIPL